jgi:ribosomal protein L35AE/L33A
MAKADVTGTVTAFRQSKFKQDSYQTVVALAKPEDAGKLLGARVVWSREDGLRILMECLACREARRSGFVNCVRMSSFGLSGMDSRA